MTDDTLETMVDYLNIDWGSAFESAYPKPVIPDPKSMAVKSDTPEDVDRLWQSVIDYGRS